MEATKEKQPIKGRVKIGDVVLVQTGWRYKCEKLIGMVNYVRGVHEIGVNFGHYHAIRQMHPEKTQQQVKEHIYRLGVDDVFDKEDILERVHF